MLHDVARRFQKVITIEDGVRQGGMGSAILEFFADNGYAISVTRMGLDDHFIEHGKPSELYQQEKLDCESILQQILQLTKNA
jgi:1-deoxy-D-xylulose-5-phosphate synthase